MKGEAENEHDEAGGGGKRHRQGCVRPPKRIDPFLDDDDPPGQRFDDKLNRQCGAAVRQGDVGYAGLLPCRGQRQRCADEIETASGIAKSSVDRDAGENALVGAGDDDVPAGCNRPRWNKAGQQKLQALERCRAFLSN